MLTTEKINEILKTLGDGDLRLDESNHCVIMAGRDEDAFAIHLNFNPSSGQVLLASDIGALPDNPRVQLLTSLTMLRTNFGWSLPSGQTVAFSDTAETFVLQERYSDSAEISLESCLLGFAETREAFQEFYQETVKEIEKNLREEDELDKHGFIITSDDDDDDDDDDEKDHSFPENSAVPPFSPEMQTLAV
ncbi:type III secretion system chaperone [Succinimonas sp.]|uniref:type III secretion system chaperone n=1 Tax=Succinimonas sp. TaxID=1936151 RepID=UPI00386439B2